MSKIGNVLKYSLMVIISLFIMFFIISFALFCAGNGEFTMGFIIGMVTIELIKYLRDLYNKRED